MRRCNKCGVLQDDDALFCIRCGNRLEDDRSVKEEPQKQYCSYCGKEHPTTSRFCVICGKSLEGQNQSSQDLSSTESKPRTTVKKPKPQDVKYKCSKCLMTFTGNAGVCPKCGRPPKKQTPVLQQYPAHHPGNGFVMPGTTQIALGILYFAALFLTFSPFYELSGSSRYKDVEVTLYEIANGSFKTYGGIKTKAVMVFVFLIVGFIAACYGRSKKEGYIVSSISSVIALIFVGIVDSELNDLNMIKTVSSRYDDELGYMLEDVAESYGIGPAFSDMFTQSIYFYGFFVVCLMIIIASALSCPPRMIVNTAESPLFTIISSHVKIHRLSKTITHGV